MPSLSDYQSIITRFNGVFRQTPELKLDIEDPEVTVVKITFFLEVGFYGETKMRIREWFDQEDKKIQYRYSWEKNTKGSGHISCWENEHPHGLETDPHHHHHVPGDRSQKQENFNTRDLEKALSIVEEYILENKQYDGKLV